MEKGSHKMQVKLSKLTQSFVILDTEYFKPAHFILECTWAVSTGLQLLNVCKLIMKCTMRLVFVYLNTVFA
jgi:hypothetical protein